MNNIFQRTQLLGVLSHTVDGSEIPRPTTWDVENLVNKGINYLSTGAGFPPSTVYLNLDTMLMPVEENTLKWVNEIKDVGWFRRM